MLAPLEAGFGPEAPAGISVGSYGCQAEGFCARIQPPSDVLVPLFPGEVNVGGIVAAVVVLLMVLALVAFGIWFAYSRGFFSSEYCAGHPRNRSPQCPPCSSLKPLFCFFHFREKRVSEAVMLLPPSWLPPLPLPAGTGGLFLPQPLPVGWEGALGVTGCSGWGQGGLWAA